MPSWKRVAGIALLLVLACPIGRAAAPAAGTENFKGATVYQGLSRTWSGIRPLGAPAGAPALILLHPRGTSPTLTANIAGISRLATQYGAWIYLPSSVTGNWNDDPASPRGIDDVGFLAALIQAAIKNDKVDPRRIYIAGYSNGGFMAERFACERSPLIAGLAVVASTLHDSLRNDCHFSHRMPVLMFDGTLDPIIPYTGLPTLAGARAAMQFFAIETACDPNTTEQSALPHQRGSGLTSVTLTRYTSCLAGGLAELYTVNGGGHTWPGGYPGLVLGATTNDVDATLVLWQTLIGYPLP